MNKGFVIDYEGNISDQQDIIIYDSQYTPLLLNKDRILYIPAESVYAVIEVKQNITKKYIEYAGKKVASVRKLKRTSKKIVSANGTLPAKNLHKIIGGIVALNTKSKNLFNNNFMTTLKRLSEEEKLDIGCCLNKCAFIIFYKENIKIETSEANNPLTYFFIKLIAELQKMGTVPAIEFEKYLKTIEEE